MDPDRIIDRFAARQHGVFSIAQARRSGMSDNMIHRRLEKRAWLRLAPGVYAVASAPPTWERQLSAAVLSRQRAIVGGSSAAFLLGFEGIRRGRPEIVVPAGANTRSRLATVRRNRWFDELGRVRTSGFVVTNEPETILMLAGRLPVPDVESVLDGRLAGGHVSVEDFEAIRRRVGPGRVRGAGKLFPLLDERTDESWEPAPNRLEALLHRLVDDPRIPPASSQHPFVFDVCPMIVDVYIAAWRLILEADGRRWHTRRADFERDRARDNAAAAHGLAVLRFTWRMLTTDFEGCRRVLIATGDARSKIA